LKNYPGGLSCLLHFSYHLLFSISAIKYWASGSGSTYIGIARVPFKEGPLNWDEGFETIKIYAT
jgi:hypothetical protein